MLTRRLFLSLPAMLAISLSFASPRLIAATTLPFKLFDTHVHFVSDDFKRYPILSNPTIEHERALREFHLNNSPSTAEKVLGLWDANGVEGGVGVQYRTTYGTDNSYLLDVAAKYLQRVAPIVIVSAIDPKSPEILRALAKEDGIAGGRFTGMADPITGEFPWLDSPEAQKTWAAANELGLVVVLMPLPALVPNPPALQRIARLADKFPNVKIVLDHIGFPSADGAPNYGLGSAFLALMAHKNVYYKFSTINIEMFEKAKVPIADFVRHAVDVFGADHLMWGSDFGNTQTPYAELVANAIGATSKLTPNERRQILRDTGKDVFVRGGRGRER